MLKRKIKKFKEKKIFKLNFSFGVKSLRSYLKFIDKIITASLLSDFYVYHIA